MLKMCLNFNLFRSIYAYKYYAYKERVCLTMLELEPNKLICFLFVVVLVVFALLMVRNFIKVLISTAI